jgi:urease accessory protein
MPVATPLITIMNMDRIPTPTDAGVGTATRLLTWLSPSFPVGGFSYSHGLEYAIEAGLVRDAASLGGWVDGILRFGAGRNDGLFLLAAHRAASRLPYVDLKAIADQAAALRGTAELAQEATAQGTAFLRAVASGWPAYATAAPVMALADCQLTYPVIVGCLCAVAGIPEAMALEAYLTAFANILISAGIRLVPLGQSDGLRIVATLEPRIIDYVQTLTPLSLDDLGGSALAIDWSSMKHETQYTRLFRS